MQPNETVNTTIYSSLYTHGVDEKRRVQIPAKWRPEAEGVELTVVYWPKRKEGACLRVWPPEKMAEMMQYIGSLPNSDPNKGILKRTIGSGSIQVPLDKAGRICLPEKMAKDAGIGNEAVLVGLLDQFEIWSPERYAAVQAADEVLAQEAFKLME